MTIAASGPRTTKNGRGRVPRAGLMGGRRADGEVAPPGRTRIVDLHAQLRMDGGNPSKDPMVNLRPGGPRMKSGVPQADREHAFQRRHLGARDLDQLSTDKAAVGGDVPGQI